ncbi:OPT oligopeptide transporter protein-domain-containing protein [Pyronema domesticum]|nr:OPT oligopeptide transporter protein-domain-containing protein [Pyronema domesticum]
MSVTSAAAAAAASPGRSSDKKRRESRLLLLRDPSLLSRASRGEFIASSTSSSSARSPLALLSPSTIHKSLLSPRQKDDEQALELESRYTGDGDTGDPSRHRDTNGAVEIRDEHSYHCESYESPSTRPSVHEPRDSSRSDQPLHSTSQPRLRHIVKHWIKMASAHFPLLRSSPAAGTASYGALPVSYQGSGASSPVSDLPSDVDADAAPTHRARRRKSNAPKPGDPGAIKGGLNEASEGLEIPGIHESSSVSIDPSSPDDSSDEEDDNDSDPADNSPYPEVRASVLATDDESLSINTPRMWTLSLLFTLVGSSTNLFFSLRYPSISITPVIALLLAHPLGKMWDVAFPEKLDGEEGKEERWLGGIRRWLGQGRWNRKEHACVYISSNVSFGFAFATDVIVEQTHFYHQDPGIVYQILLTLSTQILGYTFAGLTRQWLVRPSSMIWPGTLMSTAMFTTLHGEENKPADGWKISRWRFFLIVFCAGFFWYFIPGLLMPALSYFNAITWFAPDNVVVSNLFGVRSGLGMLPITFDWAQISYIGSPLMTPAWAAANVVGGLVVVMWGVAPVLYYLNAFYSSYMPILSSSVFDNTGSTYDVSRILTPDFLFDESAYHRYSKVFMPITYVLSYGLQFAALTALVTHTAVWHGKDIIKQWRKVGSSGGEYQALPNGVGGSRGYTRRGKRRRDMTDAQWEELVSSDDVHARLMAKYPECPTSWYLLTFALMLSISIFLITHYPVFLPIPGLLLSLCICGVFFVPIGIVMAITNTQSSLFLICQLVCGWLYPGRPVANMLFVTYGYITSTQGLKFAADLKLGHYMKIPPRLLFGVQMVATVVGGLTQVGVLSWMFTNIRGICTEQAINGFTCPIARVHFNGSILWGVVGPQRFFGRGELYRPLIWAFLIGAIGPLLIWALWRHLGSHRNSILKSISLPVLFGSLSWIPPATGLNFSAWAIVCYIFNWRIRSSKKQWWGKYTMTLSAALDASLAFGVVVVFFGVVYPDWEWVGGLRWWGTEVFKQGCDWRGCSYRTLKKGETFGPPHGAW